MKSVTLKYGLKVNVIYDLLQSYKKWVVEKTELINKLKRRTKIKSREYGKIIKDFI